MAVAGSRFTYAVGRLALWSADPDLIQGDGAELLRSGRFRHLAIANPELAPYGAATRETLEALGLWREVAPKIVLGTNVGQTLQLVATRNAELGFVAVAQLAGLAGANGGSRWDVPPGLHGPIKQDAVLLERARSNEAARAFLDFLKGPEARAILRAHGYDLGGG